jgi:hypothetical protein
VSFEFTLKDRAGPNHYLHSGKVNRFQAKVTQPIPKSLGQRTKNGLCPHDSGKMRDLYMNKISFIGLYVSGIRLAGITLVIVTTHLVDDLLKTLDFVDSLKPEPLQVSC